MKNCIPQSPKVSATAALQRNPVRCINNPSGGGGQQVLRIIEQPAKKPQNVYNFITNSESGAVVGFETTIGVPSSTWVIPHTLGRKPNVSVYDSSGNWMIADVNSSNTITTITFAVPTTGSAVLT